MNGSTDFAHNVFGPGKGVVHRDLKPDNIFLTGPGPAAIAKIGDYGLASAFDQAGLSGLTKTGEAGGTPRFLPRQQLLDFKRAGPEVDVWAMAATLYYLLTGQPPRDFSTGADWWVVVLEQDPVLIRQRNPSVPTKLASVIDTALRDASEIPSATAAELKQALEGVL